MAEISNQKKKVFSILGFVVVLLGGYFLYEHFTYVTTDNAQIQANTVMLSAKVVGYVLDVKVKENQKVKAGDILVEIEPRDFQNALRQAQSELEAAEAHTRDAARNYARISELYKKNAVTQQQFDSSEATDRDAKGKLAAVQAQVSQAKLNLEYTQIKAPENGLIAKKGVEPGMFAAAGMPLIGFVGSSERWVIANFKETDLSAIAIGQGASIDVDAIPGHTYHGKVDSISAATGATFTLLPPDNATGNFTKVVQRVPVKIVFDGLNEKDLDLLRAGLSCDVKVRKI